MAVKEAVDVVLRRNLAVHAHPFGKRARQAVTLDQVVSGQPRGLMLARLRQRLGGGGAVARLQGGLALGEPVGGGR